MFALSKLVNFCWWCAVAKRRLLVFSQTCLKTGRIRTTKTCWCKLQLFWVVSVFSYARVLSGMGPSSYRESLSVVFAFSALTLSVGLGRQEEHPACRDWAMGCWCSDLPGARCILFAYGAADATAIPKPHSLLPHLNPDWFYLSGTGLLRLSCKRGR